ncbi:MAG: NAD(P)/FAD-dependent oxidoreductase [Solirubrobacterales bacterium]
MSEAVIVGSGPNGLACAAVLARAGMRVTVYEAAETIGGGTRSSELTLPGLLHDHCSAVHPMGVASPVFQELELTSHGLEWLWPEIDMAHPFDDGTAGVVHRSVTETAAGLGQDESAWKRLFEKPTASFDRLRYEILGPVIHWPRHPVDLARFGLPSLLSAAALARFFRTDRGRALFAGAAAHSFSPLNQPLSAAVGMALIVSGHSGGWPVAKGGSRAVSDALASVVQENGGSIVTGRRIDDLGDLPPSDVVVLDTSPDAVLRLAGNRLPERIRKAYRRYRYGPGSFKVDLAVEGGVPWVNEDCRLAGTVHVGGSLEEIATAEKLVNQGRMPERPFVLVCQQYLADPSRSAGNAHPVWAYAHVPAGYEDDVTESVIDQIERFAPGLRERIVGCSVRSPMGFAEYNENFVRGDIAVGANTPRQLLMRPRVGFSPYETGIPGVFICSSATPPGGGVHGMCGANAAKAVLAFDRRRVAL